AVTAASVAFAVLLAACQNATTPAPTASSSSAAPPAASPSSSVAPSAAPTSAPSAASPSAAASAGTVAATGRRESGRALGFAWVSAEAVMLGDGRVLLVGVNQDDGTPRASTWDPSSNAWKAVDPLPKVRTGFAMVALQDGRALVLGGRNDQLQSYSSAYLF